MPAKAEQSSGNGLGLPVSPGSQGGMHKGMFIPGAGGGASAQHPVPVLLLLPGKGRHTVTGTGHAGPGNPTPLGSAPGAHVAASCLRQRFLSPAPRGFCRTVGQ